ncbi:alpha/beta hydrolase-fold protein [Bacteroidota bacterium]
MKTKAITMITLLFIGYIIPVCGQEQTHSLNFSISVNDDIRSSFKSKGRLFIYICSNPDIDLRKVDPLGFEGELYLFAKSFSQWDVDKTLIVDNPDEWDSWARYQKCTFNNIPTGTYYIQLLWDQDFEGFGINAPGNLFSLKQEIDLSASQTINLELSEIIQPFKLLEHDYAKLITHQSDTLSKFWGKPVYERAVILFPSRYFENPDKEYPIYYNVIGGFGNLEFANYLIRGYYKEGFNFKDKDFFSWWLSGEAPQTIIVYLEGSLNGNIYHLDSDNFGPSGYSLINEFIPYIEKQYRGTDSPKTRFVGGSSTGGYGSLALQVFYPEAFNGVFSYSPDPVDFEGFQTVDIYNDENFFYNKYRYPNPIMRTFLSSTKLTLKEWISFENMLGYSGTYLDSDHIYAVWTSLFSPKGADGKPMPLFDPYTGIIDTTDNRRVINSWKRYDLSEYLILNWETLGPLLSGKIYIWAGGLDPYLTNTAVNYLEYDMNANLRDPVPDVIFDCDCGKGHGWEYNQRHVLEQVAERLNKLDKK